MSQELDLESVVSLLSSHPEIAQNIASLVQEASAAETPSEPEKEKEDVPAVAPIKEEKSNLTKNRQLLLKALKPYLSEKRVKAMDTMMVIADVVDLFRTKGN